MSNWKKISLRDAVGKVVFDDEWGFIKFDGDIYYSVNGRSLGCYEAEVDGKKIPINDTVKDLTSLFSKVIYPRRYYGYGQGETIVKEITVSISEKSFTIKEQDKKRLEYLRHVWICDEIQDDKFNPDNFLKQPYFKDLKVGDEILFNRQKHLIEKVYDQPNRNGYVISASPSFEGATREVVDIKFSDDIYVLPYNEQPVSETAQFNTCKNEFELSPYAYKSGQLINVYWNKLEDAAEYTVSLYKRYDRPYRQKIYHLKDYTVERNDGFVSIDGLTDEGYVVTVKAETRDGETLALSRGISIKNNTPCIPQYWYR